MFPRTNWSNERRTAHATNLPSGRNSIRSIAVTANNDYATSHCSDVPRAANPRRRGTQQETGAVAYHGRPVLERPDIQLPTRLA